MKIDLNQIKTDLEQLQATADKLLLKVETSESDDREVFDEIVSFTKSFTGTLLAVVANALNAQLETRSKVLLKAMRILDDALKLFIVEADAAIEEGREALEAEPPLALMERRLRRLEGSLPKPQAQLSA